MTQCWTRDLCIWHYTWWRNVGLVICVSGIIQNDEITSPTWCHSVNVRYTDHKSIIILYNVRCLDSWSVYLTLYRMKTCRTRDLCIWHYTEWLHVGLVICIWHYTEWWWTCDLYIWHLQNDTTLDSWSVYLTLYRMASCWTSDLYLTLYRMTPCWTRDMCIWHYTWWCNVGLMICVSDILQNDTMRSRVQHVVILYNGRYTDHKSNMPSFCIMSDTLGLVICASDIIQNDAMLDSWSVYLT